MSLQKKQRLISTRMTHLSPDSSSLQHFWRSRIEVSTGLFRARRHARAAAFAQVIRKPNPSETQARAPAAGTKAIVSVTAGICEELLYRGFLVWALQPWVGLGWAAAVSVIAFGAAHAYQGKDVVRPTLAGLVPQGIALLTQSIPPGILVHAILDVMSGTSGYVIVRGTAYAARRKSVTAE